MSDDGKKDDGKPDEGAQDDAREAAYWDKFENRLDGWFDAKVKKLRENGTGRTARRTTLPSIMADLIFGPETKD